VGKVTGCPEPRQAGNCHEREKAQRGGVATKQGILNRRQPGEPGFTTFYAGGPREHPSVFPSLSPCLIFVPHPRNPSSKLKTKLFQQIFLRVSKNGRFRPNWVPLPEDFPMSERDPNKCSSAARFTLLYMAGHWKKDSFVFGLFSPIAGAEIEFERQKGHEYWRDWRFFHWGLVPNGTQPAGIKGFAWQKKLKKTIDPRWHF